MGRVRRAGAIRIEFKTKKSAGIPVTPAVHRLISRGNAERDQGNWPASADAYAAALALDPSLYHIQIQLGHSAKEAGRFEQSEAAYRTAAEIRGDTGEPFIQLGHLAKKLGHVAESVRHYAEAAKFEDTGSEAIREVRGIVHGVAPLDEAMLRRVLTQPEPPPPSTPTVTPDPEALTRATAALQRLTEKLGDAGDREALDLARARLAELGDAEAAPPAARIDRPLVFDLTDLIAHFRNHRLPTGIQRVQIEVLATAIRTQGRDHVQICCFIDGRDYWIGISIDRFLTLAQLASAGADATAGDWAEARARLFFGLATDPHFTMPERGVLVNLGTSWWIYDYFRLIRDAKEKAGISYVPFVHDWIPVMVPEHVVRGVVEDFVSWAVGAFAHADAFLVNSHSTRTDLLRVANRLGRQVDDRLVEVVPLDADFRPLLAAPLPDAALARWGLGEEPYVLFVSTIESRKNHVLAFEGWAELIRRHGPGKVPRLVCVGRDGWLNDRAFAKLDASAELRAAVTIIHQVSDEELALLYRCCQFTIYPSHYEGWGLPITESLCYGRIPVVANNSSLPEAGAGFAVLFDSNSLPAFVRAVEEVAFDDAARAEREKAIAAGYRPRSWASIAGQINEAVVRFASEASERTARVSRTVQLGRYYPVALYKEPRLWKGLASGELFRSGDGWLWPEPTGCRTRPEGGELRMTVQDPAPEQRLYVRLRGLAEKPCPFSITVAGATVIQGTLEPKEERWASGDLPRDAGGDLSILIRGHVEETITMSTGGSEKRLRAGPAVTGFGLCDANDEAQRAIFVGSAGFGDLDAINAYGDRQVQEPA